MFRNAIFIIASVSLLSACKLILVAEPGGSITSETARYSCAAGNSCELDLPEGAFTDTFTAIPATGFRFAGWMGLCREGKDPVSPTCGVSAPKELRELDVEGEFVARFSQNLVGSWLSGSFDDPDNMMILTFYPSGYAVAARSALDDPSATNPTGGFSYAQYTYDSQGTAGALDSNLDANVLHNSIGRYGGFIPDGFGGFDFYYKGVDASDQRATFTIRNRFGGGETTYQRINSGDNRSSLQGTWTIGDISDYENFAQITFHEGFFLVAEYCESNGNDVGGGIQRGTYTWDANSGNLMVTVLDDTLEGCGLYDTAAVKQNVLNVRRRGGSQLVLDYGDTRFTATALR